MSLRQRIVEKAVSNPQDYEIVDQHVLHIKLLHKPTKSWLIYRVSGIQIDEIEEEWGDALTPPPEDAILKE